MDSVWILMDLSDLCAFCMDAVSIWILYGFNIFYWITWPPPPKMLYGFSLYLLDLYGFSLESCICMDFVWILYRSLGSIWILYGFLWISQICVHSVWMLYPYGFCMDSIWILLDSVSVWILYGFCMDPDDIHGFCLDSVWILSGFYMDSVWSLYLYGFCMYQ